MDENKSLSLSQREIKKVFSLNVPTPSHTSPTFILLSEYHSVQASPVGSILWGWAVLFMQVQFHPRLKVNFIDNSARYHFTLEQISCLKLQVAGNQNPYLNKKFFCIHNKTTKNKSNQIKQNILQINKLFFVVYLLTYVMFR